MSGNNKNIILSCFQDVFSSGGLEEGERGWQVKKNAEKKNARKYVVIAS